MISARRNNNAAFATLALLVCTVAGDARAQSGTPAWAEAFVGSEVEEYLRLLQVAGIAGEQPWSLRPFGPRQLAQLTPGPAEHPWSQQFNFAEPVRPTFTLLRPAMSFRANSAFPLGSNDGPTWAGKGVTATFAAGLAWRAGPLSVTLAPTTFFAQNSAFTLQPNGESGFLRYADARFPRGVDRPQAFGDGSYSRFDPGESTLRLDALGVALGASTASQWWGPAAFYPVVLGNNAGGFPHAFFGTARPLNLRVLRLHGRATWGALSQSEFSSVTGPESFQSFDQPGTRRFQAGLVLIAQPTFLSGLELGIARFFHEGWPEGGLSGRHLSLPLEALFKKSFTDTLIATGQNQLLSVFARWVAHRAGMEFYAERGKDDHAWDARDLIVEPEHSASTLFGFAKVWPRAHRLTALRAEVINYQIPANIALRQEAGFYPHNILRQGHTHRGQLLGADIGAGSGAGAVVSVERYTTGGKLGLSLKREQLDRTLGSPEGTPDAEVRTTLQLETLRFTRLAELSAKVGLTNTMNWNLTDTDRTNFSLMLGMRVNSWRVRRASASPPPATPGT